ncbi:MAG: phosphate uptake regulator PhoU [Candidatus Nitrosotenuis sp.]|uniref:phosphate signaling complex PhoU family protein n=1 Tax=Candidatus Nitrosotenuis cloacae TaxID=1603555 RepID=UPI002282993C|nr:phosphate uptake regulator PhoU [Candidatus Nitrosotenuis cloacae]MDC8437814.1 phosphate uptake regulator PhoU [Candidatus Nitrosotenuis sp.]
MTKFIRRLQRIGSSILVSLPKDWVEANKLDKSNEVELETNENTISITVNKAERPSKEVVISYPLPTDENIVADITGAYLLGYDVIRIKAKTTIPVEDREKIRNSMRRLVGMEIVEEDSSNINVQFLLDATTLNPAKILKRISSIALGMFNDLSLALISDDKSNIQTLSNRDDEVDRQYFLLVRLIRSTMIDSRLASTFRLENIDVLDYRMAANILETASDTLVEIANSVSNTTLSKSDLKKIYDITKDIETIHQKSIDAFIDQDRRLAIEAIAGHRKFQKKISDIRSSIEEKNQLQIDLLDLIYMFERVSRSWADIADLVKPVYS